jgi:hypothetical protein
VIFGLVVDAFSRYGRARRAARVVEIADIVREGKKTRVSAKGGTAEHGDMVDRSRLMVDARKWLASKPAPNCTAPRWRPSYPAPMVTDQRAPDYRIYQAKELKWPWLSSIRGTKIEGPRMPCRDFSGQRRPVGVDRGIIPSRWPSLR